MNDEIISDKLSQEFYQLLNRPYYFYGSEVFFCEEREIERFENVRIIVYSNDHYPPHFHIKTINQESEYKIYLNKDFSIKDIEYKSGKKFSKNTVKSILYWYNNQRGKEKVIEEYLRVMRMNTYE